MPSERATLKNVRFHNGGYCIQSKYLSGAKGLRPRKFHAVFVSFQHPRHGGCLIDTGYGPEIFKATRKLPFRVLRWATPIPRRQRFMQSNYLSDHSIDPALIDNVFVSHFHADHIGATRLFDQSKFVYRSDSYDRLQPMSKRQQLDHGYIPGLLPNDFESRSQTISESAFEVDEAQFPYFPSYDIWGDGSLVLIDLPGHALGHTGYLLQTANGPMLYVVDAFWDRGALEDGRRLPWLSRRVLSDYDALEATNRSLLAIAKETQLDPLACHCPRTQAIVAQPK